MDLYRSLLYIFLCIISFNRRNLVDSTTSEHSNSINIPWSVKTRKINGINKNQKYYSSKPKPPKPPDSYQQEAGSDRRNTNINLIKVNFEDKQTTSKISYEYNSKTNTHSFIANAGYLFEGAEEGARTLWTSKPGRYADRINITEHSNDDRSITVYVPVDEESEHSETESEDRPAKRKMPKLYEPKKAFREVYMYNSGDEYPSKVIGEATPADRQKTKNTLDFEIQEIRPSSKINKSTQRLVSVDIYYIQENKDFDHNYDSKLLADVYTPKPGIVINEIWRKNEFMWRCEDGNYPEKLLILRDQSGKKALRLQFPKSKVKPTQHPTFTHTDSEYEVMVKDDFWYQRQEKKHRHYCPKPKHTKIKVDTARDQKLKSPESSIVSPQSDQKYTTKLTKPADKIQEFGQLDTIEDPNYVPTETTQHKIPVELNIDFRWNTFLFDYSKLNNVSTYTPKEGYAFRKVKLFKGYYSRESDLILWETDQPEKFANKVIVIGHNKIILYLDNGTTAVFKQGYNNLWIEDEFKPDCSSFEWDYQYIRLDINNNRTTEVYNVSKYNHDPSVWEYLYLPKNGYKFSLVRQGTDTIWSTTDEKLYSTKVGVIKISKLMTQVIIGLSDGTRLMYVKTFSETYNKLKMVNF